MGLTAMDGPGYGLEVRDTHHRCGVTIEFVTRWTTSKPMRAFQITLAPDELQALGRYLIEVGDRGPRVSSHPGA